MKKSIVIVIMLFLFITNLILIRMTVSYKTKIDKQEFKVYLFQGEDGNIRISDGIILISPNKQMVNGGNIEFIGNNKEKIKSYSKTIYLDKKTSKDIILSNSVSYAGETDGIILLDEFLLNKGVGEISSSKLFSEADINSIKNNLYFSLNFSTVNGKSENFALKLNVKEFNMNASE